MGNSLWEHNGLCTICIPSAKGSEHNCFDSTTICLLQGSGIKLGATCLNYTFLEIPCLVDDKGTKRVTVFICMYQEKNTCDDERYKVIFHNRKGIEKKSFFSC